jgi:LPS O-antigen subunit length determinant protein (WzzB/FepE family)
VASNPAKITNTSTQIINSITQDAQWAATVKAQYDVLKADMDAISSSQTPNGKDPFDVDKLSTSAQKLVEDTNNAIAENDKFAVSSSLKDIKQEWGNALRSYNEAGKFMVVAAANYKNGKDKSTTNIERATKFINEANAKETTTAKNLDSLAQSLKK